MLKFIEKGTKCNLYSKSYRKINEVAKTTRYKQNFKEICYILTDVLFDVIWKFKTRAFFSVPIYSVSQGQPV